MVIRRFDKCLHLNLLQEEALGKLLEGFKSSDIGTRIWFCVVVSLVDHTEATGGNVSIGACF